MTSQRIPALLILLTLFVAACVTVNVYFPEAEIRDMSRQIEEEIQQQAADEAAARGEDEESETQPQARRSAIAAPLRLASQLVFGSPVYAQSQVPSPGVSNPAIRRIIDSRAARLPQINRFKASGVVGENNKSLLEIRALDQVTDLRQRATLQRLVKDENADRERLFEEMAAATSVERSQIPRLRETYAATIREKSRAGDWIQLPNGTWRQK
jgi:uncharacterized protein YdbL (DUF1318 family)